MVYKRLRDWTTRIILCWVCPSPLGWNISGWSIVVALVHCFLYVNRVFTFGVVRGWGGLVEWVHCWGYRMVTWKMWVEENFGLVSESQERFWLVLNPCFRIIFVSRSFKFSCCQVLESQICPFFLSVWSSGVESFRVCGCVYRTEY